ncbi:ATP-binding protein [Croceibacterium sp. TMG7-5b_MA50]|uniref:tetratricopeptide repeat-containing sensor histidine kinase n=1 Tax=Croceibacterium sp. TMG7-5b_MA50 TaxID=3121290 RepID=UPI0032214E14
MTSTRLFLPALLLLAAPVQAVPAQGSAAATSAAATAFDRAITDAKAAMMADPRTALAAADRALVRAAALPGSQGAIARATALWLRTEALIGLNRMTEAQSEVDEALALAEAHAPRTKLMGDLLRARGSLSSIKGQVQAALADLLAAHDVFRIAGEPRSQAIALMDIAQLYGEGGDYSRVLRYNSQALDLYDDDPAVTLAAHNNNGEALRTLGRWQEAEREFAAALTDARKLGSPLLEARILGNLALVQVDGGKLSHATRNIHRALTLSQTPDAAEWRWTLFGVLAKIAAARGNDAGAVELLDRAFAGRDLSRTDMTAREFHELAARIYHRQGQVQRAYDHLAAFNRIDSEARQLTATASSQLMAAQFDFANQNLRIAQLREDQLQRDVQLERQRGTFRTTIFALLGAGAAVLLGLMGWTTLSIRRSRNQVRSANTVLTRVNTDLERALRAKTDFLAMTSHEIRTPLNGILGMTQVMLTRPDVAGETREQVQLVHGAGETMRVLVDDILDLAKMEAGEITVEPAPTRLSPIVDDALALWRARAAAKGLRLVAELDLPAGAIETDGARVRQILHNLLSNAIKFTASGEVRLVAATDRSAGTLILSVSDTGIGIAPEDQAAVFEAFHQVDSAMTRQFSGTGLGLAISRNLAEALGGAITLASTPGIGSTFTLQLPLREVAAAPRVVPASLADARIGIVDPDGARRLKLAGLLRAHCAAAVPLDDAAAALDSLADGLLDGLLADGAGCTPALLAALAESGVPAIVLAGEGDLPAFATMPAATVLAKPVPATRVLGALRDSFAHPLAAVA